MLSRWTPEKELKQLRTLRSKAVKASGWAAGGVQWMQRDWDNAGVAGAGAQEAECHLGVLKFADGFKKSASFVDASMCVGSNIISDGRSEQLKVAMEAAGAIGIAQEAVREVGDKLGSRERAEADNLTFVEVKLEADVNRTLLHTTESRRDCALVASKDAIIKVEGGEVQGALLKLSGKRLHCSGKQKGAKRVSLLDATGRLQERASELQV